jgi:hypothetical protein
MLKPDHHVRILEVGFGGYYVMRVVPSQIGLVPL